MATTISTKTTIFTAKIYTDCIVANSLPLPLATTLSIPATSAYTVIYETSPASILRKEVFTQFNRSLILTFEPASCLNYLRCSSTAQPNPDIGGVGIILAFLITAWASFLFLFWAYVTGRVPQQYLGFVDRKCFRVNSHRCSDKWAKTMQKVILTFSDQQLATGLAIIIAGFIEAYKHQLDTQHWQFVIYLAWMSSTVHLITISFLRTRLQERTVLRNMRVIAMLVLLVLLNIAIAPQLRMLYLATSRIRGTEGYMYAVEGWSPRLAGFPVQCFWNKQLNLLQHEHLDVHPDAHSDDWNMSLNTDAIISYLTLCTGYIWKLSQLFSSSSRLWRRWLLAKPSIGLESAIDRQHPPTSRFMIIKHWLCRYIYVLFLLLTEGFNSFAVTLMFLAGTLAWGTLQLLLARQISTENNLQAESELSFGQLLPLLLFLQPLSAILEHLIVRYLSPPKKMIKVETRVQADSADQDLSRGLKQLPKQNTMNIMLVGRDMDTLSETIKRRTLRDVEEKMIHADDDPVVAQVCQSRVFRAMIFLCVVIIGALAATILFLSSSYRSARVLVLQYSIPASVTFVLIVFACCLPVSHRLS